jgi:t-SNARE complex subunit (syntaxin)
VTEISRLQQIISTNLAEQAQAIDSIYAACVDATDSISAGNVHLRSAAQKLSSANWNMFLFIMICNFCLIVFHLIA